MCETFRQSLADAVSGGYKLKDTCNSASEDYSEHGRPGMVYYKTYNTNTLLG